ncbi:MAG TPA: hypothetical protein VH143_34370 [Kofleriaceae bacterium]|jgi:hypothetical protein|nr:hypothetical protein [Kofleriaceae bacterium]
MSDRTRALAVFGVVGAIAAAAGYYFFEVYRPSQVKAEAQAQVAEWETRWNSARGCLLGATPGSPSTREALAIHDLQPDPWDRGACTALMGKLTRGDVADTGLADVEAAWRTLDHAATKAAAAFAEHAAGNWSQIGGPLPAALDALDAARAKLRIEVGLTVEPKPIAPLPAVQVLALADGSDAVMTLDLPAASAHGLVTFGKTKADHDVQIALPIGGAPSVMRVGAGSVRGVPDATWGATIIDGKLAIGAMDADAKIAAPLATDGKRVASLVAALGTLADGTVIYGGEGTMGVAHVKAGAVTLEPPIAINEGGAAIDTDGRAAVWWTANAGSASVRAFGFGEASGVAVPSPEMISAGCLTADHAQLGDARFDGTRVEAEAGAPSLDVLACSRDAALLADAIDKVTFAICGATCRKVTQTPRPTYVNAVALVDGKLVTLEHHDDVLAVWRDGHVTFYSAPAERFGGHHAVAWSDGKVIELPLTTDAGVIVLRVPAH